MRQILAFNYNNWDVLPSGDAPLFSKDIPAERVPAAQRSARFTIVTPSLNQLDWLRLCAASVADQEADVEHFIHDAGSEGIEQWESLAKGNPHGYRLELECKRDDGMYDAINRGFLKATGDILAWLNCDEQYLPGALKRVEAYLGENPEIEVLFGDALLAKEDGDLLSYRRAVLPTLLHTQLCHLGTLSCATFVRRSVVERGLLLDSSWKTIGDAVWVADMLKARVKMAVLHEPLAVFTMTNANLGQTQLANEETERWKRSTTSPLLRMLRMPAIVWHRLRKFLANAYTPRTVCTALYTLGSPQRRIEVTGKNLSFRWPSPLRKS